MKAKDWYRWLFRVVLGLLGAALIGAVAWAIVVAHRVQWHKMDEIGQFGDAMAPAGLVLAALSLVLTAISVQLQREDFKAQLKEMQDATRYQERREIYETFERVRTRLHTHRRACRDLVTRAKDRITSQQENYFVDAIAQGDLERTTRYFKEELEEVKARLKSLAAAELTFMNSERREETQDERRARTELIEECVRWHCSAMLRYFEVQNQTSGDGVGPDRKAALDEGDD